MARAADESLRSEIKERLTDLKGKREQVRLRIHLAAMDAKDAWEKIEAKLEDAENRAERATGDTARKIRENLVDLQRSVSDLLGKI